MFSRVTLMIHHLLNVKHGTNYLSSLSFHLLISNVKYDKSYDLPGLLWELNEVICSHLAWCLHCKQEILIIIITLTTFLYVLSEYIKYLPNSFYTSLNVFIFSYSLRLLSDTSLPKSLHKRSLFLTLTFYLLIKLFLILPLYRHIN